MSISSPDETSLDSKIINQGSDWFEDIRNQKISLFDPNYYTGKLMNWAMADAEFRTALFRFVDVLPSLRKGSDVVRHAQEYFQSSSERIPGIMQWGMNVNPDGIPAKAAAVLIRKQVEGMATQFILGKDPQDALKSLKKIRQSGLAFTVDLLGEACLSEKESEVYLNRYLELIETLDREVRHWKEADPLSVGHPGEETPVNVSVKLSALYSRSKPVATDESCRKLGERLRPIFRKAREKNAFVYIDMEDTSKTDITLNVLKSILMEDEFRDWTQVGFVMQAYLRRTEKDVDELIEWLKERKSKVAVRLVKGAYWDTETILAKLEQWPIPVWQEKSASDVTYEKISRKLLDNHELVMPAFASHNLRSLAHAAVYAEQQGLTPRHFEFQTLYGMADPVKKVLTESGFLVREYAPIGELLPGMAYLVRRLLENTSNEGFVKQGFHDGESAAELLKAPEIEHPDTGREYLKHDPRKEFRNSPFRDFSIKKNRAEVQESLDELLDRDGGDYPRVFPIVNGEAIKNCEKFLQSDSPENTDFIVSTVGLATKDLAAEAVQGLKDYFPEWRDRPAEERIDVLYRAADLMEDNRADLTALIIVECGKPWIEADGDVAEAIDFCRYYAFHAAKLSQPQNLCPYPGEEDHLFYEPRGVCAAIGPWNFPSAIPCGMFAAALVIGNTVIMKPAEQSPTVAEAVFRIFLKAGMPKEAAAFLPGLGETVGSYLVGHEDISTIVFTGSKAVGLNIIENAAKTSSGQTHVKRVVAEMGGKNAIVIDGDADLDQAVKGILYSAFGYAGQKCSACSRLYVHENLYDRLLERLGEAVESLKVGPASNPASDLGPVIDDEAMDRLKEATNRQDKPFATAALSEECSNGRFFPPTVYADLEPGDPLLKEELFGPVLGVSKVPDLETGIRYANESEYGLTGAVFSRSPVNLQYAAKHFRVGNLYLNRGSTGALVGRQPFGGSKMSGVGSKAGGPDYLLQFTVPRLVSENTLRQGFAPMEGD